MDTLKEEWGALAAPASTFGSGWVWLYVKASTSRSSGTWSTGTSNAWYDALAGKAPQF
jgi:superoxide dismutase